MVQGFNQTRFFKLLMLLSFVLVSISFANAGHHSKKKRRRSHKQKKHTGANTTAAVAGHTVKYYKQKSSPQLHPGMNERAQNRQQYKGDNFQYSDERNPYYQVYSDEQGAIRMNFEVKSNEDYYKRIELNNQAEIKREKRPGYFPMKVYDESNGKDIFSQLVSTLRESPADIFQNYNYWINRTLNPNFGYYLRENRYSIVVQLIHNQLELDKDLQFKFFRHIASIYYTFHAFKFYPASYPTIRPGISRKSSSMNIAKERLIEDYGEERAPIGSPRWLPSNYAISRIFYNATEMAKMKKPSNRLTELSHVFIHSLAIDYYMRNQIYFSNHPKRLAQFVKMVQNCTMGGHYLSEANLLNFIKHNKTLSIYSPIISEKASRTSRFIQRMDRGVDNTNRGQESGLNDYEVRILEFYRNLRSAPKSEKTREILKMVKNNQVYFKQVRDGGNQGTEDQSIFRDDFNDVDIFFMTFFMKMQQEGPNYLWREVLVDMIPLLYHEEFDFIRDYVAGLYFDLYLVGVEGKPFIPNDNIYLANLYHLFSKENYIRSDRVNSFVQKYFRMHGGKLENNKTFLLGKVYKTPKDIVSKMMSYTDKGRNSLSNHDWEAVIDTINREMGSLPDIQ